jgi:hypothetical protein
MELQLTYFIGARKLREPLVERERHIRGREARDACEGLDKVVPPNRFACNLKIARRHLLAVVERVARPPAEIGQRNQRNLTGSDGGIEFMRAVRTNMPRSEHSLR